MPQAASEAWRTWLSRVESDLTTVADHYYWPLDILKTAPAPSAGQLPNELLELRESEIQPAPEVSVNLLAKVLVFLHWCC